MGKPQIVTQAAPAMAGLGMGPAPSDCSPEALKKLELAVLIDRFGPLDEEVRRHKPTAKTHEAYRKELERRVNESAAADASLVKAGIQFDVNIGPRASEREISDPVKAHDLIRKFAGTLDSFKKLCRFRFADIDALRIPAESLEKFVTEARTGRRSVEAVRKADPLSKEAA